MKYILCIGLLFFLMTSHSQIDTLALKSQVENIHTEKNHTDFWDFIYERDQNMFKSDRIEEINFENLILASYYFNQFGYPDVSVLGDKSKIINMVWVHNKYYDIKKLTYPIILQGYLKKVISEFNLREYYLRILYQRYFDDHGHMTKPLSQIYKELEPNLSSHIDVQSIIRIYLEKENYFDQRKVLMGLWKADDIPYNGTLNGNPISHLISGQKVMIYQMPDGKYFFELLYDEQSHDPVELKAPSNSGLNFQFKEFKSQKTYQIMGNGDLEFSDEAGSKLVSYHPVKQH